MVNIRKSHLRKSYLVGLPEVGLPESISHQKVPPQLLCIVCIVFALLDSFKPTSYSKKSSYVFKRISSGKGNNVNARHLQKTTQKTSTSVGKRCSDLIVVIVRHQLLLN